MPKAESLKGESIRADFPIFSKPHAESPLCFLDSAASSQKPQAVLDVMSQFYSSEYASVHRGVYKLSQQATHRFEQTREKLASLIGVSNSSELVFTSGCTEAINLVCSSWGRDNIRPGDVIAVTRMEHHSNFVPWQNLAREKGAKFKIVELDSDFRLSEESLDELFAMEKLKVLAFPWVSNVLGVVNPVAKIAARAKKAGALVVVDGAQAVGHIPIVKDDLKHVDFLALSAHKMFAPTGVGALWGRKTLLQNMKPYQLGGGMISEVRDMLSSWNEVPWKFEAGTPNISGVLGLGAAVDYIQSKGLAEMHQFEQSLGEEFLTRFKKLKGVKLLGPATMKDRVAVFSFVFDDLHANDVASFLDQENVCVRVGHHCTQPLHQNLLETGSLRASLRAYNNVQDIERFFEVLSEATEFFRKRTKKKSKKEKIELNESTLREWLRDVQDPELKMGLVDLGLIYNIDIQADAVVNVKMTLTSPGCPVAGVLVNDVKERVQSHPLVKEANVELVWDPKWDPKAMASEDAKEILGIW